MAIRIPVTFSTDASSLDRELTSKTQSAGSRAASFLGKTLKRGALVAGAGVASVLGTAFYKGFSRLNQIDQAEAKLKGLGYTGGEISGIMKDVTASVTGTAFGLDEAAGAAAGALASGIKEGKSLEKYLTLVGDAATQAGTDFGSMSDIFNKIQGDGRLTGQTLNQLTANQLYALPMLAKAYEVPQAEMRKMVSAGEISAKDFRRVLEQNIGGSAQRAGDTVQGSFKNTQAALARFGAALLQPAFKQIPGILGNVTAAIDSVTPAASAMASKVGQAFVDLLGNIDFSGIAKAIGAAFSGAGDMDFSGVVNAFKAIGDQLKPIMGTLGDFAKEVAGILGPAFVEIGQIITGQVIPAFGRFVPAVLPIANFFLKTLAPVVTSALSAVVGALQGWYTIFSGILDAVTGILTGDWSLAWEGVKRIVQGAIKIVVSVVTNLWNVIKSLFSSAGTAIVGVWRGLWRSVGNLAKVALKGVVNVFKAGLKGAINLVRNGVKTVVNAFRNLFKSMGNLVKNGWKSIRNVFSSSVKAVRQVVSNAFNGIRNVVGNAMSALRGRVSSAWSAIRTAFSNGVSKAVGVVKGLPGKLTSAISPFTNAGKRLADAVWKGLKAGFSKGAGFLSDVLSSIRSGINSILGLPKRVGGKRIGFTIPAFARGTNFAPGGMALVGEEGPELVDLPRGAKVYTASQTDAMIRAESTSPVAPTVARSSSEVVINQNYYGPTTGRDRLREMEWAVRYATNARAGAPA